MHSTRFERVALGRPTASVRLAASGIAKNHSSMPTKTVGMPSIRNIHCQPCSPPNPSSLHQRAAQRIADHRAQAPARCKSSRPRPSRSCGANHIVTIYISAGKDPLPRCRAERGSHRTMTSPCTNIIARREDAPRDRDARDPASRTDPVRRPGCSALRATHSR